MSPNWDPLTALIPWYPPIFHLADVSLTHTSHHPLIIHSDPTQNECQSFSSTTNTYLLKFDYSLTYILNPAVVSNLTFLPFGPPILIPLTWPVLIPHLYQYLYPHARKEVEPQDPTTSLSTEIIENDVKTDGVNTDFDQEALTTQENLVNQTNANEALQSAEDIPQDVHISHLAHTRQDSEASASTSQLPSQIVSYTPDRPSKSKSDRKIFLKRKPSTDEEVQDVRKRPRMKSTDTAVLLSKTNEEEAEDEMLAEERGRREAQVKRNNMGTKRPRETMISSAERVLKKPFRPPSRVPPKSPSNSVPTRLTRPTRVVPPSSPSTSSSSRPRKSRISLPSRIPDFPDFSSVHLPKYKRSTGLLTTSNPSSNHHAPRSDSSRIASLERELLLLKQAVKYATDPEEDHKVEELVNLWRQAGRDAVERLFPLHPTPDKQSSSIGSTYPTSVYDTYPSTNEGGGASWGWGWDSKSPMSFDEILKKAPRNEEGDPVDHDGNLLFPMEPEDEMERVLKEAARPMVGRQAALVRFETCLKKPKILVNIRQSRTFYSSDEVEPIEEDSTTQDPPEAPEWNYAALMRLYSVDPGLLGWNVALEDWDEV
ncbi:hypothetical protein M231_07362 [Tremella mesenterica]|uniref:Uncharacterized protein n=1 Tax=Tremella mesenterica TaxID=5217 RepID=A0A4Q1B9I8_TREME|nr:hypothetical protein M231_07362 [Tremella mesenterica]